MNTLSFKTTLTLALIALSSGTTTYTSSFARMAKKAVPVASFAFLAQQTQQQKANQTDDVKKHVATSQPTFTGPTFNTPIAAAVAQTKTPTALSWIRLLLPVARCEEAEQQPSTEQKPSIDFSKIRKISEIDGIQLDTLPIIAKYTLSNGKELWFFLDRHDNPKSKCSNFAKSLITNENFTHGIIEIEILFTALLNNDSFISFQEICNYIRNTINLDVISTAHIELYKQEKIIVPGEFSTPQEAIEAYKKEGLSPNQMIYLYSRKFGKVLSETAFTLFGKKDFSFEFTKEKNSANIVFDTFIFARDKKIAQTIVETMHDPKAERVLITYGAAHHETLAPLLEEHFGKPTFITPGYYSETIKQRLFSNDAMTSEEYEELLAAPEKRISAVATMFFMAFTFIGGMRI